MTLALGIGWCVITVVVAAYLAGRGFMHPRLGGIFWPTIGLDSGFQPVEIPGTDASAAGERFSYGQIETAERER